MEQAEAVAEAFQETEQPQAEAPTTEVSETPEVTEATEQTGEEQEAPEFVEVEYEGETYEVPAHLKEALLRQADYTQKTQEVSEQRKQVETQAQALQRQAAEFQQAVQLQEQNLQGYAQLAALQNNLQQYEGVDWQEFSDNDPAGAQKAWFAYQQSQQAAQNLQGQLQQQTQALQAQRQQATARQLEQGMAELKREIPNWGSEVQGKLVDHGTNYGFNASELKGITDPRMIKVLHDAYLYNQSRKAATTPPKVDATPAKKVRGKGPVSKDPDKMTTDEWLKWRQKQLNS